MSSTYKIVYLLYDIIYLFYCLIIIFFAVLFALFDIFKENIVYDRQQLGVCLAALLYGGFKALLRISNERRFDPS